MLFRLVAFLLLNFGALALGSLFTSAGVSSAWYAEMAKAPWSPPGWVFGFAWTTIMICFSVYMAQVWKLSDQKKLVGGLYSLQWILNVLWNPTFFYLQSPAAALCLIIGLTLLVGYMLYTYGPLVKFTSGLIVPYFLWLLIATSLNWYIVAHN